MKRLTSLAVIPSSFWEPASPKHSPHTKLDLPVPALRERCGIAVSREVVSILMTLIHSREEAFIEIQLYVI